MRYREDIYAEYGLESSLFKEDIWRREWGERLRDAGLGYIEESILIEAKLRRFLSSDLSSNASAVISLKEDIRTAEAAEDFRQRVASVDIKECMEPLVDLRESTEALEGVWTFTKVGYHEACGEWANLDKLFLVRSSVASRLSQLAYKLASVNIRIHFEDGFRPPGVQEGLFARRIEMARKSHPEWSAEQVLLEAKSKTAFTPRFAAHKAGAAVDISIYSSVSGRPYDIGRGYPGGGELVRQDTEFVTQIQWQNRKVLEYVARSCGLFMYPFENWHLCYGDTTAAVVSANTPPYTAKFGPIKSYDPATGNILSSYSNEEVDMVFQVKM